MKPSKIKRIFSIARILAIAIFLSLTEAVIPVTAAQGGELLLVISSDPSGAGLINSGHPGVTFYLTGTAPFTPPAPIPITIRSTPPGISANAFITTSSSLSAGDRQLIPIGITIPAGTPRTSYVITVADTSGFYSSTIGFSVTPRLTVTPASGVVGSAATVTGDGFQAFSNIYLYWDASPVPFTTSTVTTNAQGILAAANISIPAGYRGLHSITAADVVGATEPVAVTIASKLTIAPTTGSSGDIVILNGTGFLPETLVSIRFDAQTLATVITDSNGGFGHASITIPPAVRGSHTITAQDTQPVSVTFSIGEKLSVSPDSGFVGETAITVYGSLYDANVPVLVYWDFLPVTITPAPVTNSSGNFLTTFLIPATTRGAHTVRVQVGAIQSTFIVTVNSKITSINPTGGKAGSTIKVSGTGFAPAASTPVIFDGQPTGTVNVSDNGSFTDALFTIPASSFGAHTVNIQSVVFNISTIPGITISPASGSQGNSITITGNGFSSGRALSFKLDENSLTTNPANVISDLKGSFSNVIFNIPSISGNVHTVTVTDQDGNSGTAVLAIGGQLIITPSSGTSGTQCTMNGSGFTPNTPVSIYWDAGATPVATPFTSTTGTFNGVAFNIPSGVSGAHVIKAQDSSGNQSSATFTTLPKITISPTTGVYRDTITVGGTGFDANSNITMAFLTGGSGIAVTLPAVITTDNTGSYSSSLSTPGLYNGSWVIQARDAGSNRAEAALTIKQQIIVSPTTGPTGVVVTVDGTGFSPGKVTSIKYNGIVVTTNPATLISDTNGSLRATFVVPASSAGNNNITASDGNLTAEASYIAATSLSVNKPTSQTTAGYVGMDITVTGSGFKPNSAVSVTFEGTPVTVATVVSDSAGSFSTTFQVPVAKAGTHIIRATDGSISKEIPFFMDSTAPGIVTLSLPSPQQPVAFNWNAVTDPSGVTYTLQISQDPAFITNILEKTGLTNNGYTMAESEKLMRSKSSYYWRVRAIDMAQNTGEWSGNGSFVIGYTWPVWIMYALLGIGVLVILIIGIWIGRRINQSYY